MDFLGMGPLEIFLILILAFLFFGPEKLPGMAAKAGQMYRKFKKYTFDISKTITNELSSEKNTIGKDLSNLSKTVKEELSPGKNAISEDLSNLSKSITEDLSYNNKSEENSNTKPTLASKEVVSTESNQTTIPLPKPEEKVDSKNSKAATPKATSYEDIDE